MHRLSLFAPALIALIAVPAAAVARPQHIVSANLCTDQLLLALADRGQITALSGLAADPTMSAAAAAARGLPRIHGSAEEVIALRPDLVLTAPGWPGERLVDPHARVIELPPAEDYPTIVGQIRQVAAAIGHPGRGRALIARMDAALAALPPPRPHGTAAFYQRRGYLSGSGTLVDGLMRRVGLANLAVTLGRPALSYLPLEVLVAARPDYLIVERGTNRIDDQGSELLHHPILAPIPRLVLPEAWTVCGGPAYVDAARSLAQQLAAKPRHDRPRSLLAGP